MKKQITTLLLLALSVIASAQTDKTFVVKKKQPGGKVEYPKIYDYNISQPGDTACGSLTLNLTSIYGQYDSMALYNLKFIQTIGVNTQMYQITTRTGNAIVTFYKAQKDGSFSMIYYRNWTIKCR